MVEVPESPGNVVTRIYESHKERNLEQHRPYLGASMLGHECDRYLFYVFRWAFPERRPGRLLRLFETGDIEEKRVIEELQAIGVPVTSQQQELTGCDGHMKGHLDGIAAHVPEAPKSEHVLEVKTHNEKSFKALLKDGVKKSKPMHYVQMQLYMLHTGLTRALYIAVNKNDDSLYSERVHYDAACALATMKRAARIVRSETAPGKLSEDPAFYVCNWCSAKGICHEGEFGVRNCRTCLSSTPIEGGKWHCSYWDKELSLKEQREGCNLHRYIPVLVPGEQVDAFPESIAPDRERIAVLYRCRATGVEWTDGGEHVRPA
jgi:hypothetical protein